MTNEAEVKELAEKLEVLLNPEDEVCQRCEGNGQLYADGRAHYPSSHFPTIPCSNCSGSGYLFPKVDSAEIAQALFSFGYINKKNIKLTAITDEDYTHPKDLQHRMKEIIPEWEVMLSYQKENIKNAVKAQLAYNLKEIGK